MLDPCAYLLILEEKYAAVYQLFMDRKEIYPCAIIFYQTGKHCTAVLGTDTIIDGDFL